HRPRRLTALPELLDRVHDESSTAGLDEFGYRAAGTGDHRRAAGHRLDHNEAEWLRPVDREQQRHGASQEAGLRRVVDLAEKLDQGIVEQRADFTLEVAGISRMDFCGDLQGSRRPTAPGDA